MKHLATFVLIFSLALSVIGCARKDSPAPQAAVDVAESTPAAPTPTDADHALAIALNDVWSAMQQMRGFDERIRKYNEAVYGDNTPASRSRLDFLQRFYEDMDAANRSPRSWDAQIQHLTRILETHRSDLAERVKNKEFASILGNLLSLPYGMNINRGDGNAPPTTNKAKECADYFAQWVDDYASIHGEKRALIKNLNTNLAPRIEKGFVDACGVTPEEWDCGKGAEDLNLAEHIRTVLKKHYPQIADEMHAMIKSKMAQSVARGQSDIKRRLSEYFLAQKTFRDLDLDGNGIADYWTADVAGLYRYQIEGEPLRLVTPLVALSDRAPLNDAGFASVPTKDNRLGREHCYYFFQVVTADGTGAPFAQDTDGSGKNWRNRDRFAVCAMPKGYGRVGRQTYLLTEQGAIWHKDTDGKPVERLPDDPRSAGWTLTMQEPEKIADWDMVQRLPLAFHVRMLSSEDTEKRARAVAALGNRCAPSQPYKPEEEKEDEDGSRTTRPERRPLTPAALNALLTMLDDPEGRVRGAAAQAIHNIGHEALAPACARVKAGLAVPERRYETLHILHTLDPDSKDLIAVLVESLNDETTRAEATSLLNQLGPKSASAVPALIGLLDSNNADQIRDTIWALNAIGAASKPAIPRLAELAAKGNDQAFEAMIHLGADQELLDRSIACLLRAPHQYCWPPRIMEYLRAMGERAVPLWMEIAVRDSSSDMEEAQRELVKYGKGHPEIVELFAGQLTHIFPFIRRNAAQSLGHIGSDASSAVPALTRAVDDEDEQVRQAATEALAKIRGQ